MSVPVRVLESPDLARALPRLDRFEGPAYRRELAPVAVGSRVLVANLYAIRP